ncbi:MAG: hypothetical protein AAF434_01110 [Pseudomonadota bacterium]
MDITESAVQNGSKEISYSHRQWGIEMTAVICMCAMAVVVAAPYLPVEVPHHPIAALLLVIAWLFSSLKISIEDGYLRWRFGPGLIRGQVAVSDIRHAQRVRLRWHRGWGIRRTRTGWLYNVTGRKAVLIKLKSGKNFILGCEQPDALVRALLQKFADS